MLKIFFPLLFVALCSAQPIPPDSVWTFAFDDDGDEFFYDAIEVEDGYLLCGEAREWNALAGEALLVKIDRDGNLAWARTFPHDRNRRFTRLLTAGEQVDVAGEFTSVAGLSNGLFAITFQGQDSVGGFDTGFQNYQLPNLAEFATGPNSSRTFYYSARGTDGLSRMVKETFAESHTVTSFATEQGDVCLGIAMASSSPTYCGKRIQSAGNNNGFGARRDVSGATHSRTYGGPLDDYLTCGVVQASNSTTVLAGSSYSYTHGGSDIWLLSIESEHLDSLWSRHYGGMAYEDGVKIVQAADDGFIIAGNFSSEDIEFEQSDYWLLKVEENGDSVWSVLAGGEEADRCEGMIETQNGFLLFGASQSFTAPGWDACAMLLAYVPDLAAAPSTLSFGPVMVGDSAVRTLNLINTGSNTLTVNSIGGSVEYFSLFDGPATVNIGDTLAVDVYFAPTSAGARIDTLLIESDALSGPKSVRCLGAGVAAAADDQVHTPTEFALHPPYPNPFNAETVIEFALARESRASLELYDATGRLVRTLLDEDRPAGTHRLLVNASGLPSGSYFVSLTAGDFHATQKLVVLK